MGGTERGRQWELGLIPAGMHTGYFDKLKINYLLNRIGLILINAGHLQSDQFSFCEGQMK